MGWWWWRSSSRILLGSYAFYLKPMIPSILPVVKCTSSCLHPCCGFAPAHILNLIPFQHEIDLLGLAPASLNIACKLIQHDMLLDHNGLSSQWGLPWQFPSSSLLICKACSGWGEGGCWRIGLYSSLVPPLGVLPGSCFWTCFTDALKVFAFFILFRYSNPFGNPASPGPS